MRNKTKLILLVCTALTALSAFSACNAIADTSGLSLAPETVWIRLVPGAPFDDNGARTAVLTLDFSKDIPALKDDLDAAGLAELFNFEFEYPEGTPDARKIKAVGLLKSAVPVYRLTVINVPEAEEGVVLVSINRSGITPSARLWALNGDILPEPDLTAALVDFRFKQSENQTLLSADVVAGINQRLKTVVAVLPLGSPLSPLVPTITCNTGNSFLPAAQSDWTDNVLYTISTTKTRENNEKTYTVSVMQRTDDSARVYFFGFEKKENYPAGLSESVSGDIDEATKTITVTVPAGTDMSALKPTIVHSGAQIAPLDLAEQNFSTAVKYTVTAENGTSNAEYWVTVVEGAAEGSYGITLTDGGAPLDSLHPYSFPDAAYGYGEQTPLSVTVTNTGNRPTGALSIALSGAGAEHFILSAASLAGLGLNGAGAFTVRPKTGLVLDSYSATLVVSGGNAIRAEADLRFAVEAVYDYMLQSNNGWTELANFISANKAAGNSANKPVNIKIINAGTLDAVAMTAINGKTTTAAAFVSLNFNDTSNNFANGTVTQAVMSSVIKANTFITMLNLPESVQTIGNEAFRECTALISVNVPASVSTIELGAFFQCTALTRMDLAQCTNLDTIGASAFRYCTALGSVTLPANLVSLGTDAFNECTSLTDINLPSTLISIGNDAFKACVSLDGITLPAGLQSIGDSAFRSCINLSNVTLPDSLTAIGANAFESCSKFTEISWPASVSIVQSGMFASCMNLASVTLPSNITELRNRAFTNCPSLLSITLPSALEIIHDSAFQDCTGFTSIVLPASLTSIYDYAFWGCTNLLSVSFNSIMTASSNFRVDAFRDTDLYTVYFSYTTAAIGTYKRQQGGTAWTKE